eukprot:325072_1
MNNNWMWNQKKWRKMSVFNSIFQDIIPVARNLFLMITSSPTDNDIIYNAEETARHQIIPVNEQPFNRQNKIRGLVKYNKKNKSIWYNPYNDNTYEYNISSQAYSRQIALSKSQYWEFIDKYAYIARSPTNTVDTILIKANNMKYYRRKFNFRTRNLIAGGAFIHIPSKNIFIFVGGICGRFSNMAVINATVSVYCIESEQWTYLTHLVINKAYFGYVKTP